jgi:hypothetical protein
MKIAYRCFIVLLLSIAFVTVGFSQNSRNLGNLSPQGRDFWLAVPLNDVKAQPTLQLGFYVTSSYNTLVTLEVPGTGLLRSKKLRANEVAMFSTKDGSASYDFEIVTSQVADPRGVHIFADQPISVYMMNAKQVTSDGYLALPVNAWGTEYIHCAYYDFGEFRAWGAGFIVVASEDKTEVTITLRGRVNSSAKTRSGSSIGDTLGPIVLNKGEVYNVVGDATTRGEFDQFDLTGSKISANKPIGVISYHERTMLPVNNTDGRDHICEMMPPVSAWGKKYTSIEFQRDNKGDYYRVVTSQPNTVVSMKYYDIYTKQQLGKRDIVLQKAGDFYEDFNTWKGNGNTVGFNGITRWEANKPILVLQYAYSSNWDKGSQFDPFMIVLTPQEQYLRNAIFQTPISEAFVNNYFNFIIEGDTADVEQKKLKSLNIDGDTVYRRYPQLLQNSIPGTNLYWGRLVVTPGPHRVSSATLLGGYVYGFGTFNSYGWPAVMGTKSLTDIDTLPPVLTSVKNCGDYTYKATELRNFTNPISDTSQIDQGIRDIYIIDSVSTNYQLQLLTAPKIIPLPKVTSFDFKLTVIDKTKTAFAVIVVIDRAGNYAIDTLRYLPTLSPDITPSAHTFKVSSTDTTLLQTITITNQTNDTITIQSLSVGGSNGFSVKSGGITQKLALLPSDSHIVTVEYKPKNAAITPDRDSLRITFVTCGVAEKHIPFEGILVNPEIILNSFSLVFTAVVIDSGLKKTVTITNPTTDTVRLRSIALHVGSVFSITRGNIISDTPLAPKAKYEVEIQYKPSAASIGKKDVDTLYINTVNAQVKVVTIEGTLTPLGVENDSLSQSPFTITATPNPADETMLISLQGNHQDVRLRLFDIIGHEIPACSATLQSGKSIQLPNLQDLPIGTYRLVATSTVGQIISTILLLIQR